MGIIINTARQSEMLFLMTCLLGCWKECFNIRSLCYDYKTIAHLFALRAGCGDIMIARV